MLFLSAVNRRIDLDSIVFKFQNSYSELDQYVEFHRNGFLNRVLLDRYTYPGEISKLHHIYIFVGQLVHFGRL